MPVWDGDGVPDFRDLVEEGENQKDQTKTTDIDPSVEFDPRDFPKSTPPDQEDKN